MSSSSSSKRHSLLPSTVALPKAPVRFPAPPQTLTIAESAILTGSPSHTITLGADAVVHPRARLDSSHGPVTVGRRCIISERCVVGAASASDSSTTRRKGGAAGQTTAEKEEDEDDVLDDARGVILGDYVRVDVGAVVEAGGTVVGDGCVLGVGARVGRGAVLGKHCTLTAKASVAAGEAVPDFTVVYGNGQRRTDRRDIAELKEKAMLREIEVLRRLIPSNPAKFQ